MRSNISHNTILIVFLFRVCCACAFSEGRFNRIGWGRFEHKLLIENLRSSNTLLNEYQRGVVKKRINCTVLQSYT
uniref:Putative secreted peptide n=1 Tax=Anopheles braziliensis TaxID=58242 RepID=A0A2M3ZPE8_9DIPT